MNAGEGIGKGNIAVGVVSILIAILGCATGKLKNPCFAIPYGLLSFIVTIIFLVITIAAGALGSSKGQSEALALLCGGTVTNPQTGKTM
jgi:hypothetical protein